MRGSTRMRYGKNQKRPTVLCIILSMLFTSPVFLSGISYAQTQTFVMGNYTYSGKPPTGDGSNTLSYPTGRTIYFSRTATLAPADVVINWNAAHGKSSSSDSVYCNISDQGTSRPLSIESGLISAGSYGGVDIFKTNITGLYASVRLYAFSSYALKVTAPDVSVQNGIIHNVISIVDADGCQNEDEPDSQYFVMGGLGFYSAITFYTDQTYTPGNSKVELLKNGNYHVRIRNEDPGPGVIGYSYNLVYDLSALTIAEPTCLSQPVASGSTVSGTTVDLGHYSPNDIINGATSVPFAINLANCRGLRNINVTLTSTTPATDPTLLGNILTMNNATGVGLEISGAANNYYPQTLMIPNDATSIYQDQHDTTNDNNIYGTGEDGKVQAQTLNFLATLKRDSNHKIGSGNFKANGIFTFDYP